MPLQTSGCGCTPPVHTMAPPMHAVVPVLHGPVVVPQAMPSPVTLSSTVPSQSLSMPSQTSVLGPM
jgi:hypothetical protein